MSEKKPKDSSIRWEEIVKKYFIIKQLYIECEETDPELKTNLQPMNEFKAALDHTMRLIAKEKGISKSIKEEEEQKKLLNHLKRAFFDVCDMLSMNYRNKIIDVLQIYSPTQIRTVLPDYYSVERIRIEEINIEIAKLRNDKGQDPENEDVRFETYVQIIQELKDLYAKYKKSIPALEEIRTNDEEVACTLDRKEKRKFIIPLVITSALSLAGLIATIVLAIV